MRALFATTLRIELARNGITQQALADRLGCTQVAVSYYTQAKREPSYDRLCLIADTLGVTTDYLLGRTPALEPGEALVAVRVGPQMPFNEPMDDSSGNRVKEQPMQVITNEVHVDLIGFELSVTCPPDCGCEGNGGCSDCGVKTITIDAAESEDGHAPQRLVLRGHPDDMRRMFSAALMYVDTDPASDAV